MKIADLTEDHYGSLIRYTTPGLESFIYYAILNVIIEANDPNIRFLSLTQGDMVEATVDSEIDIVRSPKAPSEVGSVIKIDKDRFIRTDDSYYVWKSDKGFSYTSGEVEKLIDECFFYSVLSEDEKPPRLKDPGDLRNIRAFLKTFPIQNSSEQVLHNLATELADDLEARLNGKGVCW